MNPSDDIDISHFRADRAWVVATEVPAHRTLRLISLLYVFAGLSHLWLADAWQWEWLPGNIAFILGLALLLFRPCALGWAFCAVGKLLPLLFARDHLTQSLLLLIFASGGAYFVGLRAYLSTWPKRLQNFDSPFGEISAPLWAFFDLLRLVTIATYAVAAFHKLNRDFFNPDVSCAVHGIDKVTAHYGLGEVSFSSDTAVGLAIAVIAVEGAIALLYILRRRRLALIAAIAFHIPLTLTVAPAFAFVMLIGHAAFVRPADIDVFANLLRRRGVTIAVVAGVLTALSQTVGQIPFGDSTMIPREWLLWALLIIAVTARPWRPESPSPEPPQRVMWPRFVAWTLAMLFVLHSLTPYLGIRFQHTGAMVSNLRIDEGCWNHLLMPESMRLEDRYIRIDEVYFVEPGRLEKYETISRTQLWNGTMLYQMQKNWCRDDLRPFYLAGTYRDRHFEIDDLCAEELVWPFDDDGVLGVELFPEHLLFQRNLPRQCPQVCIH